MTKTPTRIEMIEALIGLMKEVYSYATDLEAYGSREVWQGAYRQFLDNGSIEDDCESFGLFCAAVLQMMGVPSDELAEVVTDVNGEDNQEYDHHVLAVKVEGVWHILHCWAFELLSIESFVRGHYNTVEGYDAVGQQIVGHRLISRPNDTFTYGKPV